MNTTIIQESDIPIEIGIIDRIRVMKFLPLGYFELRMDGGSLSFIANLVNIVIVDGYIYLKISELEREGTELVSIGRVTGSRRIYPGDYGE